MKFNILKSALVCSVLALISGVALAQTEIIGPDVLPSNAGFTSPGVGKFTNFDATVGNGGVSATPWQDTGVNYANTGIEPTSYGAPSGWEAFEQSSDDGAYQIATAAGYTINTGDIITLTWLAEGTYNGTNTTFSGTGSSDPVQVVQLLTASSSSAAYSATTPVATLTQGLPGTQAGWVQYSVTYTAQAADAGKYVGAAFTTTTASGKISNSFAVYDNFYLSALPAGSKPVIVTEPASQTAYSGATVTFSVSASGATSYQWMAGATGSGIYTNLLNAGQFSGVTTPTLTITNVQPTNNGDYVVVVSNGNGSVSSTPPANLTVASILYQETFTVPNKTGDIAITNAGWVNDIQATDTRLYSAPNGAVYSYTSAAWTEAFYATTVTETGVITDQAPFLAINLATANNLGFNVTLSSTYNPNLATSYFAVQMNWGQWYVSTNAMTFSSTSGTFPFTQNWTPTASAWNVLTLSGNGSVGNTNFPVIGGPAPSNLSGYITGAGLVCVHTGGGTHNFDNFTVLGAIPPNALPVINAPPFSTTNYTGNTVAFNVAATTNGTTAGLTYQWMYGTVGSGIYSPLSNSGQFSGVNTSTLTISNVTSAADHKDYVLVVTDGAGSVTSTPPATLTVVDSVPLLTSGALVYPNTASQYGSGGYALHAGNNNVMNLTASFAGDLPMTLQWQFSTTNDGTGLVNLLNATNSLYTLSNPQTNNSGYYRLQASNSQGGPTNSAWAQVTVLPASTSFIQWAAPVSVNGLTAAQILNVPGTFYEAESFVNPSLVNVTNGATVYVFDNSGAVATVTGLGGPGSGNLAFTGDTGDTNLNTVLTWEQEDSGTPAITINNLTNGVTYSVQLFGLDDTHGTTRYEAWAPTNDTADVSASYQVGNNNYVVGTFVANSTNVVIDQFLLSGHGYINAVIVRVVPPAPTLSIQKSGANLVVNYANGTLLESTNVNGPWTTNSSTSPYTFTPTQARMFFRVQQ